MAFVTYHLHHLFVTGLNPFVASVALSLTFLLIAIILWLSLKLKEKRLRIIACFSLIIAFIIPPIISGMNQEDAFRGVPRRYYMLPDSSEKQ